MPKNYNPQEFEPKLIDQWMNAGCYQRSKGVGDCTVCIPPPNVTGMLHMGHAMDDTIQDTFVRFNRMNGKSTRWILGTDHAGIATQTKVDKKLKSEGVSRLEIGREKFIDECWDWTHEYGGIITEQIKRMGCSIDFDDEKFTMDDNYEAAVRKVFCDWYHDGLIYRGKRIVNWCPDCTTAISDDEAEYADETGHLWYMRYPLVEPIDGQEYIVVATTRPETMLGDTGVAVPVGEEYKKYVGAKVMLPIVNREIPIFSDWHVDAEFGTGFVKCTPAHDPNDYAMGEAHGLEKINIFDEHAVVVDGYGEFTGMDRNQCREAVVAWFEENGLMDHIEEHEHSVMHCYRCDAALEPWLSEQWFVAVDKLKEPALDVVRNGKVTFHPQRWESTYTTWMENLKDWCISRQLWWGHRIPVFYCPECGWEDALETDPDCCPKCGHKHLHQDENVLDTWFSSQLWTFATQGWPTDPSQMEGHHPTQVLVTARDIIALWVARMIMSSLYFTGEIPFHDVFIYATILAKDGSRMSKSKGNGVDPMALIETYGADAMRYNLLSLITNNQDVRFDAVKENDGSFTSPNTANAKSFVTKIWNASRFVLMNMDGYTPGEPSVDTPEDAWMFSRLAKQTRLATDRLNGYEFGDYARDIQKFFWNDFCDWYIELCKSRLYEGTDAERLQAQRNLMYVLDASMRLLHPVMPFVTEAVWDSMPSSALDNCEEHEGRFLMMASWPCADELSKFIDDESESQFELAKRVVSALRSARARYQLSPRAEVSAYVKSDVASIGALETQREFISKVGFVKELTLGSDFIRPEGCVSVVDGGLEIFVEMGDLVDLEAEVERLKKNLVKAEKDFKKVAGMLSNQRFLDNAKQEIIDEKMEQKKQAELEIEKLKEQIADLS